MPQIFKKFLFLFFTIFLSQNVLSQFTIEGELQQYHKTTITFTSELTYQEEESTYFDLRLDVTITSPSGVTFIVPGYFLADGNAAETSATAGNQWRVNFNPSEIGNYTFSTSFKSGTNVAVNGGGTGIDFDGTTGSFTISETDKSGNDFRAKGKLNIVGEYAAQFANGDYYFEVGADSPETFLEYADFDATGANNTYSEVANNFASGDPSWQGGKGTEIIGAVNYLANQGMNIHYFLTNNITGDGNRAYPFINTSSYRTYDVSKLSQWGIVFDHMYNKGLALEIVLLETENLNWFEDQEGISSNNFSDSRKIYYRELIARFGYLNVIWNIGEEANWSNGGDQYNASQIEEAAAFIEDLSPYEDFITVHNGPSSDFSLFPDLVNLSGTTSLTGISMQGNYNNEDHGNGEIAEIRDLSNVDNKKWVVRYTEPFSGVANPNIETWTNDALWASICAGSVGIHYYAGAGDDIRGDNYTNYAPYYQRMRFAKDFIDDNNIPFWEMSANNDAINRGFLLSKIDEYHVIFLENGGTANIDLEGSGDYDVKWFNPRNGGNLLNGTTLTVQSGANISIGSPPNSTSNSWVVFLEKNGNDSSTDDNGNQDGNCDADYEEVNNIVVIEAENLNTNEWSIETATPGFSGTGYLEWGMSSHFNDPGNGLIATQIQINDPGTYRFQWRSKVGEGNSPTDENDTWLRFPDADEFFGQRGSSIVYPKGSGQSPNPNGSGSDGWFKVYSSGTTNWTWSTRTSDNDPHDIFVTFDSPGVYTMEISARSSHHFVDRIVLSKSFSNPTDLSINETECDGNQGAMDIPVESVELNPQNLTIDIGETERLNFTISPSNATNKSVSWSSSNTSIVNVDANGNITGLAEGTATIEISTEDGGFTDTATIVVETPFVNVTSIDVTPSSRNVILGETTQLSASVNPTNASNKAFSWSSNNTAIATVDNDGLVTTLDIGTVIITATSDEGGFTDTSIINVNEENNDIRVESVSISPQNSTIDVGENQALTFDILPSDATDQSVSWSSSNNNIATVNANGVVRGVSPGQATITILTLDGNFTDTATVTVEAQETDILVDGVTISTTNATTVEVGRNINLIANVTPSNATNKTVVWSSSDTNMATVNANGFANTLSEGVVTITATTVDGEFTASIEITIIPIVDEFAGVTSFVLVNTNNSLDITEITNGTIIDGNFIDLENLNIRVNTLPSKVGSVSIQLSGPINLNRTENVVPYAIFGDAGFGAYNSENLSPGNYVLTATAYSERRLNGEQIGSALTIAFEVRASTIISVDGIMVNPNAITLDIGDMQQLSAVVSPANATNQEVLWTSSNDEIATVDSGGLITAISEGEVEIIAISSDGNFSAIVTVTVLPLPIIPVESISISPDFATLNTEENIQLSAIITPTNATNKNVLWSSSDEEIATIDSNGFVTAISEGNVQIIGTSEDGNLSSTASITVVTPPIIPVESIVITPDSATLNIGEGIELAAIISPTNATNKNILWSSSNEEIATVDSNGFVTAINGGIVEIIATSLDGNLSSSSFITVLSDRLPIVAITSENFVNEGENLSITMSLDISSNEEITFDINYIDVTTNQSDYSTTIESVTFLPNETEKTIVVETINDTTEEEDEVFQIEFTSVNENLIGNVETSFIIDATIIDNDKEDAIILFPNPAEASENITLSGIQLGIYEVNIFSISGNLIASQLADVDSNAYEFSMPANISTGIYLLRMLSIDNVYVTKVMIR